MMRRFPPYWRQDGSRATSRAMTSKGPGRPFSKQLIAYRHSQKIGGIKSTDAWVLSHAKCDFADEPLCTPIKAHFPFLLTNHLFNNASAKASARRCPHRGAARFRPAQIKATVVL